MVHGMDGWVLNYGQSQSQMTRRFGIYAKVTPKQPRLVIFATPMCFTANTPHEISDAFRMAASNTDADEWFKALPALFVSRNRRKFKRPNLPAPRYKLVARLVRNRNRGAASGLAQ